MKRKISPERFETKGLSSLKSIPLGPGCFLPIEDQAACQDMLNDYVAAYQPQHRDEMDLLREAVYAKFRQERVWHAETGQIEVAIARNERELQRDIPTANAAAHLANGFAHSEDKIKLFMRYDAQLHRHFKSCLQQLHDLQDRRRPRNPAPKNPGHQGGDVAVPAPGVPSDGPQSSIAAPAVSPSKATEPLSVPEPLAAPGTPAKTDAQLFEEMRERILQRYYPHQATKTE